MRVSLFVVVILLVPTMVTALPLGDNVYLSMLPDSIQCVDILLPDDLGAFAPGLTDYQITSNAEWGDLTTQTISTDENNSVRVPLCFSSYGKKVGDCTDKFSLSIAAPSLQISRGFAGGVCVSLEPDVDYAAQEGDPKTVLSTHADVFDMAFSPAVATAGEPLSLRLQSSSTLTLDVDITGLPTQTVLLSPATSVVSLNLTPTTDVQATARVRGCADAICTKSATARLSTGVQAGFTAQLFPRALDVKNKDPVTFTLSIQNFGAPREFQVALSLPDGLKSGFTSRVLSVDKQGDVAFQVQPENGSALYLFSVTVTSQGSQKTLSASLSTNELLTDAARFAEDIKTATPSAAPKVDAAVEDWYSTYASSSAGSEVDDYGKLQKQLGALQNSSEPDVVPDTSETLPTDTPIEEQVPAGQFPILWIGVGVAAVVVIVVLLFLLKRPKEVNVPELEQ